jgi:hypothetical protein
MMNSMASTELAHQTTFSTTFLAINEVADESHTSHLLNLADLEGSDLDNLLGDLNIPGPNQTHSFGEEEKLSEDDCFIDDDSLMKHLMEDP